MTEQQDWFAVRRTAEVDLQAVAKIIAAMELSSPTKRFELGREETGNAVDCFFVVAGGFDLDQFADGLHNLVLTLREIEQSLWA